MTLRSRISPCRRQATAIMRTGQPANRASSCHQDMEGSEDVPARAGAAAVGFWRVLRVAGAGCAHMSWRRTVKGLSLGMERSLASAAGMEDGVVISFGS